jgi:dienelactone hydrolase
MRTPFTLPLSLLLVGIVACSDDGGDTTPTPDVTTDANVDTTAPDAATDGSSTTLGDVPDPGPEPETPTPEGGYVTLNGLAQEERACSPFSGHGPYPVGVTTLEIAGHTVEVWYPAAAAGEFRANYDMRDWLPESEQDKIPDEATPLYTYDAYRDAMAADGGPFPLVLFSHGLAAYRLQSSIMTAHIASYGYVVAAPDHPERGLARVVEFLIPEGDFAAATLVEVRDGLAELNEVDGGLLSGRINMDLVAVSGHSAGGGATYRVLDEAEEGEFDAYMTYASGAFGGAAIPAIPGLVMMGNVDGVVRPDQTLGTWAVTPQPAALVNLKETGHLAFSDLCVIGRDRGGILQIARENGIEVNDLLVRLGTDGCDAEVNLAMEVVFPAINGASVAFLEGALRNGDATGWQADYADCWADIIETSELSEYVPSEGSGGEGSGSEGSGSEGSGSEGSGSEGSGS